MQIIRTTLAVLFFGSIGLVGCAWMLLPASPTPQETALIAEARTLGHSWGAGRLLWRCREQRNVSAIEQRELYMRRIELFASQRAGSSYRARIAFLDAADEAESALLGQPLTGACITAANLLTAGVAHVAEAQRRQR